jgi:hypothetical protein
LQFVKSSSSAEKGDRSGVPQSERSEFFGGACDAVNEEIIYRFMMTSPPVISSPYHRAIKLLGDPMNGQSIEEIASIIII